MSPLPLLSPLKRNREREDGPIELPAEIVAAITNYETAAASFGSSVGLPMFAAHNNRKKSIAAKSKPDSMPGPFTLTGN